MTHTDHPLFTNFPLGAHPNVDNATYHQRGLGVVSKGALDAIARSPLHYQAWLTEPDKDTPALAFGRAFHCAILEPERFATEYASEPDFGDCRKKENKAARDAWRESNRAAVWLPADDWEAIEHMVRAVRNHELGRLILRDGDPEVTLTWLDKATGLPCKARPDYLVRSRRMCVDVKTTDDASEEAFARTVAKYRYHVQDALYRDACAQTGEAVEHFLFVAVEKTAPYAVNVHTLDEDAIGRGYTRARIEIELLADCVKRNEFPGYPPHIHTLSLPPWVA